MIYFVIVSTWLHNYIILYSLCNGERFEPRSHFKSRLSMIVRVNAVLNRTVVYDSVGGFDNFCGGHLQSKVSSITSSGQRSAMMMAAFFEAVVCVICWHLERIILLNIDLCACVCACVRACVFLF